MNLHLLFEDKIGTYNCIYKCCNKINIKGSC